MLDLLTRSIWRQGKDKGVMSMIWCVACVGNITMLNRRGAEGRGDTVDGGAEVGGDTVDGGAEGGGDTVAGGAEGGGDTVDGGAKVVETPVDGGDD
ncbi:hypothetical protein FJT64_013405 [Amphibalanus amphitrite]|uniref:Uncharacterized protein n=1 Tax=Amphibalanus amphitrite TaxID=1232801 RepID=A0A6A4VFF0_AMPAM|nr:hypothetical protein FJT64_013405 [Amphibalanus amphitrite]